MELYGLLMAQVYVAESTVSVITLRCTTTFIMIKAVFWYHILVVQDKEGNRISNGIQYRLQLLFANGLYDTKFVLHLNLNFNLN